MKTKYVCENCRDEISGSQLFCGNCGSKLSDEMQMYNINKEKNTIKFINISTMKEFMEKSGMKKEMYSVKDKEKSIVEFINYAQLKKAEEWLIKRYSK